MPFSCSEARAPALLTHAACCQDASSVTSFLHDRSMAVETVACLRCWLGFDQLGSEP